MSNTVDVSPERIAAEWATLRADLGIVPGAEAANDPGYEEAPERERVEMKPDGFDVPEVPTGVLLSMTGSMLAGQLAPNWVAHGLTDTHIQSVAMPAGTVIDKWVDKFWPGQTLGEVIDPVKEELALIVAVFGLYQAFKGVPRKVAAPKKQSANQEQLQQQEAA